MSEHDLAAKWRAEAAVAHEARTRTRNLVRKKMHLAEALALSRCADELEAALADVSRYAVEPYDNEFHPWVVTESGRVVSLHESFHEADEERDRLSTVNE
jgi:hypothetical protein